MSNIIQELEAEQMGKELPEFGPGDTVVVQVKVVEGQRERLQAFEGVCIAKRNRGLNTSFTVRKISHGEGVERVERLDAEDPFHADKASLPWLLSQWNQLNTIPGTRRLTRTRHEQMTRDTRESIFGPTGGGPESAWRSLPREVWPGDDAPLRGGALGPGPN